MSKVNNIVYLGTLSPLLNLGVVVMHAHGISGNCAEFSLWCIEISLASFNVISPPKLGDNSGRRFSATLIYISIAEILLR